MRFDPIAPAELMADQRPLFDLIQDFAREWDRGFLMAREDGAMLEPYNPMLHVPQFGSAVWNVNVALAKPTALPKAVHELATLVMGATFSARYELYAHEFVAEKAGLSAAQIAALAAGLRPADLTEDEAVAFDVASALSRGARLPESTYRAGKKAFGEQGMAELIFLYGFLQPHLHRPEWL